MEATGRKASSDAKAEEDNAGKPPKWPEVEQEVRTWILEQRQTGISVWTKMIQELGERIAHTHKTLVISQGHLNGVLTL